MPFTRCMKRAVKAHVTLEFAAIAPIILLLLIGVLDITTMIRGYAALREGVESALRCAFPAEGRCLGAEIPGAPQAIYRWEQNITPPRYFVDFTTYSARASWVSATTYQLRGEASIPDEINFRRPGEALRVSTSELLREAEFAALIRSGFPELRGSDPRNLRITDHAGRALAPDAAYALDGVALLLPEGTAGPVSQSSRERPLPQAPRRADEPCLVYNERHTPPFSSCSHYSPWSSSSARFGDPAAPDEMWRYQPLHDAEGTTHNTALLVIKGSASGTAPDSSGRVRITLHTTEGSYNLGGQQFDGPMEDADFFPRGADLSRVPAALHEAAEFSRYQAIRIPYGGRFSISLTLERVSGNGTLMWRGDSVELYLPRYERRTFGPFPCDNADSCDSNCSLLSLGVPATVRVDRRLGPLREETICLASKSAAAPPSVPGNGTTICSEVIERGTPCLAETSLSCGDRAAKAGCAAPATELASLCGVPADADLSSLSISTRAVELPAVAWTPRSCSESAPAWAGYGCQKLISSIPTSSAALPAERRRDPEEMLADPSSDLRCPAFSVSAESIDDLCGDNIGRSLFGSAQPWDPANWIELLYRSAIDVCNAPPQVWLEPSHGAIVPVALDTPPRGSPFRIGHQDEPVYRSIPGGPWTEDQIPSECRTEQAPPCRRILIGYLAENGSIAADPLLDDELAAAHFGYGQLRSVYPRARAACSGVDCARIEVRRNGELMEASGAIELPLALPSLFGRSSTTVSYSRSQRWEGSLLRE